MNWGDINIEKLIQKFFWCVCHWHYYLNLSCICFSHVIMDRMLAVGSVYHLLEATLSWLHVQTGLIVCSTSKKL